MWNVFADPEALAGVVLDDGRAAQLDGRALDHVHDRRPVVVVVRRDDAARRQRDQAAAQCTPLHAQLVAEIDLAELGPCDARPVGRLRRRVGQDADDEPRSKAEPDGQRPATDDERVATIHFAPMFSYHRSTPPAPVHTMSLRRSPLMSTPTQLFIALSSILRYVHSPVAGSAGAKNTCTPPA